MIAFTYSHVIIGLVQVHYTDGTREVMTQTEFTVAFINEEYDISGDI